MSVHWKKLNVKIVAIATPPRGGLLPTTPVTDRGRRRAAARAALSQG